MKNFYEFAELIIFFTKIKLEDSKPIKIIMIIDRRKLYPASCK